MNALVMGGQSDLAQACAQRLREDGLTFRQTAERMGAPSSLVTSRWFAWCRAAREGLTAEG